MMGTNPMVDSRRQCTAKAKSTGKRCQRAPIKGGSVCPKHGGSAPQVKEKARLRLAFLVDPSIETLADFLKPESREKHPSQALGAAKDVLDRTGHKTPDEVNMGIIHAGTTLDLDAVKGVSTEKIEITREVLRLMMGRGK